MPARTHRLRLAMLSLALVVAAPGVARTEPPSVESLEARAQALFDWMREQGRENVSDEAIEAKARELLEGVEFSELSFDHLEALQMLSARVPEAEDKAAARLKVLAAESTADGAKATMMLILNHGGEMTQAERIEAYRRILENPELKETFADGELPYLFTLLGYAGPPVAGALAHELVAAAELFDETSTPAVLGMSTDYLKVVQSMPEAVSADLREEIRRRLVVLHESALEGLGEETEDNRRAFASLRRALEFLDTPIARGEVLGNPAPELAFIWNSEDLELSSLADLRGKVVVLDFWATWCGPCIASFPDVKKLQERYEGHDVAIIGLTSLQGRHYHPDRTREDTTDDPEKEFALMKGFIDEMDMTWTVAFAEQDVYNPDYGVRGIPHVTIIDATGKVRANAIHPNSAYTSFEVKADLIDALLREAGLEAPEPYRPEAHD